MTKQEIEKAIENGESVWIIGYGYNNVFEIKLTNKCFIKDNFVYFENKEGYSRFCFYKTKAEAEHYLHHANVTRTETLPFLTWEEFKKEHYFGFSSIYNEWIDVYVTNGLDNKMIITIENATKEEFINNYDLTEENFYKAYDECVRLFRCGE